MFFVRVRKNKLFIGKIGNVSPDLCEFDNNFLLTRALTITLKIPTATV